MSEDEYASSSAMWESALAQGRARARERGVDAQGLQRRLVYSRFLARVFASPDSPWVLKGGTAALMRVPTGRTTKDVDLLAQARDLPAAVAALRRLAAADLGDHFRFVPISERDNPGGAGQPNVTTRRVTFDAFCGTQRALPSFGVDVVIGSLMTAAPDETVDDPIPLRGITPPMVRLYPLVDHIADKLCATMTTYGSGASSRERDLVDLVVFALSQDVDGAELTFEIHAEWVNRDLDGSPRFEPPAAWRSRSAPLARKTPACTADGTVRRWFPVGGGRRRMETTPKTRRFSAYWHAITRHKEVQTAADFRAWTRSIAPWVSRSVSTIARPRSRTVLRGRRV